MNNRRSFLKKASLITAGGVLGSHFSMAHSPKLAKKAIGLQLYSLREAMKEDALGTLKKVSKIGFTTLEAANYSEEKIYGMNPQEFKKTIHDFGMKLTSAHVGGPNYSKENHNETIEWWKTAIERHAEAGANFLIKPSMPIPETLDELKVWCDYYNDIGEQASSMDITFGFHNHAREFEKIEGEIMYDFMLEDTDPQYFAMEMDVYWVTQGGYNPVDYLKKYAGRFPLLHIKDEKELGESGDMDYKPIFEAGYAQGLQDYYVEVEKYNFEPIESVEKSFMFLAEAEYVK